MFLKKKMNDSTNSYSDKILQIKEKIGEADAIIIGSESDFLAPIGAGFLQLGKICQNQCARQAHTILKHQIKHP